MAVLTIFLYHSQLLPHVPGELATTVFFFLSGFLITTLFLRERAKTGDVSLKAFYYRRALRILPPLYLVLSVALIAAAVGHVGGALVPWKVAGNFFQFTNYAVAFPVNESGFLPGMVLLWSLAVDEHFYLLFAPVFKVAAGKLSIRTMTAGILVLCAGFMVWRIHLVHAAGEATFRVSMASDTRMDSILWGAFLALWRNPSLAPKKAGWLAHPGLVAAGLLAVFLPTLTRNEFFQCTAGYTLQGIGLIPVFSAAILHGQRVRGPLVGGWLAGYFRRLTGIRVGQVLEARFLVWMSQISYPFYLLSWLTLSCTFAFIGGSKVLQVALAFLITYVMASAVHVYLELPLASLRRRSRQVPNPPMALEPALAAS